MINTGQDIGKTLFFIKEDGTVSKASIEYGYSADSDIEIEDNINGNQTENTFIPKIGVRPKNHFQDALCALVRSTPNILNCFNKTIIKYYILVIFCSIN